MFHNTSYRIDNSTNTKKKSKNSYHEKKTRKKEHILSLKDANS
jgi:hypothetical protein